MAAGHQNCIYNSHIADKQCDQLSLYRTSMLEVNGLRQQLHVRNLEQEVVFGVNDEDAGVVAAVLRSVVVTCCIMGRRWTGDTGRLSAPSLEGKRGGDIKICLTIFRLTMFDA